MAKQAIYKIKAKDETKQGINSAVTSLRNMDKSVGALGNNIKGLLKFGVVAGAIKGVTSEIKKNVEAISIQQKAELQLNKTAENSPFINGEGVKSLKAYASQLQSTSVYGDEMLIGLEAQLIAQGKSEDQIKSIMQASVDLASAGVMPLESAVKNLAKTYSGTAGELAESIPALKELTKEQLANGEAVTLVGEAYKGMAESVAGGIEGQKMQLSNIIGDIRENLGDIWVNVVGDFNSMMLPVFTRINDWITEYKDRIINFIKNFPQIALRSFKLAFEYLKAVFNWDFLKSLGSFMWKTYLTYAKTVIGVLANYLKAIGQTIWEPLKYGFEVISYGIKKTFFGVIDFFTQKLNWLIEGANKIASFFGKDEMSLIGSLSDSLVKPTNNIKENIESAWKEANENTKEVLTDAIEGFKDGFEEFKDSNTHFADILGNYKDEISDIVNQPIVVTTSGTSDSSGIDYIDILSSGGGGSNASPFGGTINPFDGDYLLSLLGDFGSGIMSVLGTIQSVNNILNPLNVILTSLIKTIGPTIDKILQPLLGGLAVIGELLGQILIPILEWLTPVVKLVAEAFIWIYNSVLRPIGNFLIGLFNSVGNAIAGFVNGILQFVNDLTGSNISLMRTNAVDWNTLKEINMASLNSAGSDYVGGSSSGSSGGTTASYTGVRDINVYVEYNVGISAFDDRDIALKIRNEIKSAEAMGF